MQNPPGSYPPPQQGFQPGGYPGGSAPSGKTQTLGLEYNVAAGVCYVPFCLLHLIAPIIWIATEPKTNKLVRLHAFQSLIGFALVVVMIVTGWIIGMVIVAIGGALDAPVIAFLGLGVAVLMYGVSLILGLAMVIMGLVKGFGGQYWKFPIIGNLAEKFA